MNWWMRFCFQHKGSISIFLSIILLPMLWLIGIMVDTTNNNLSKSVVEGAGEMTVNAALANYDTVLADVYGLFAISQTADDLRTNLEHYFQDSLTASGLMDDGWDPESETAQAGAAQLHNVLDLVLPDDLTRNFIQVEYTDFTAGGLSGSSLANPEILKSQVVEFMKYRGPAEAGMSLLDSLGVFKKVGEQAKVLKKKAEKDEKVANLAEESQKLYSAIVHLDQLIASYETSKSSFYRAGLMTVRQELTEADRIIRETLANAINTDNLPKMEKTGEQQVAANGSVYYIYEIDGVKKKAVNKNYTITDVRNDFADLLNRFPDETSQMGSMLSTLSVADNTLLSQIFERYRAYAEQMKELFSLLLRLIDNKDSTDDSLIEEGRQQLDRAYTEVVEPINARAEEYDTQLRNARETVGLDIKTAKSILNDYCESAKKLANAQKLPDGFWETIRSNIHISLASAIDYTLEQAERVRKAMEALDTANDALDREIQDYERSTAEDDFSTQTKSEVDESRRNFTPEDLTQIKRQLEAIKTYLGDNDSGEIGRVTRCAIYGESILELTLPSDHVEAGKKMVEKYRSYGDTTPAYSLFSSEQTMTRTCFIKQIGSGTLVLSDGTEIRVPSYFIYMSANYSSDGTEEKDEEVNKSAESINQKAKEDTNTESISGSFGSLAESSSVFKDSPSSSSMVEAPKAFDDLGSGNTAILGQLASMMDLVINMASDMGSFVENGRDNLLVTQYVDSNFSSAVTGLGGDDAPKTMTNVAISKDNNPLYGCEMEYIIYGNKGAEAKKFFFITLAEAPGPKVNISCAKNNILAIRFACNAIFAISNQNINNHTFIPAMAIQTATGGFFPYKVAQVVLDVCLAYAESLADLSRMKDGEKVELIKTYTSWTMKPENLGSIVKNISAEVIETAAETAEKTATSNIQRLIDNAADSITKNTDSFLSNVNREVSVSVQAGIDSCQESLHALISDRIGSMLTEGIQNGTVWTAELVRSELEAAAVGYLGSMDDTPLGELARSMSGEIVNEIASDDGIISKMNEKTGEAISACTKRAEEKITSALDAFSTTITNKTSELTRQINSEIAAFVNEQADALKDTTAEQVAELTDNLSEKLSNKVNGALNKVFPQNEQKNLSLTQGGSGPVTNKNSGLGEIFKFSYQDYLRLFLFLELNRDSDAVMLRIADVIQVNAGQGLKAYAKEKLQKDGSTAAHPKGDGFHMADAYTYVQIGADVKLKPLLLSQKLFRWSDEADLGRFGYHFETIKGY